MTVLLSTYMKGHLLAPAAMGAKVPNDVIDVDAPATSIKGPQDIIDVDASDDDNINEPVLPGISFMWCRYPPTAQQQRDATMKLLYNDFVEATPGLSFIHELLPHPLHDPLCPPETFCVAGEMLSTRRLSHSEKNETAYISLGELDMMLAIVMADGQYNDHVTIIPCSYTKNVFWLLKRTQIMWLQN